MVRAWATKLRDSRHLTSEIQVPEIAHNSNGESRTPSIALDVPNP